MSMGHNPHTLTSANAVLMIRCKGVYDNFIRIEGFQTDAAWDFGEAKLGETRMGVDGKQSGGYTPHEVIWGFSLEANSKSRLVMENIRKDFNNNMETRLIDIVLEIPSIKSRHEASGFWTTLTGGPSGKKLLDGQKYNFSMVDNGAEDMN